MGSSHSKPIEALLQYTTSALNALLGLRLTLHKLGSHHLVEGVLTPPDLATYQELHRKKANFIANVQLFATRLEGKLNIVNDRLQDENFQTLSSCYKGFSREDTLKDTARLQSECVDLQKEFHDFKLYFAAKYTKNQGTKVARFIGLFVMFAAALGCAAVIILHVIPGVNVVVSGAVLASCAVVGTASLFAGVSLAMSKSEVEIAEEFLKNIEQGLRDLKTNIIVIRANNENLSMVDRKEASKLVCKIIAECQSITKTCEAL